MYYVFIDLIYLLVKNKHIHTSYGVFNFIFVYKQILFTMYYITIYS
jgi:hypothetical protein